MQPTEDDVWNKENGARNIVLVSCQPQIGVHALNLRIANVSSVNMRKKV